MRSIGASYLACFSVNRGARDVQVKRPAIEEDVIKHDLAIRPIFHRAKQRIEAHIFVAFLAYVATSSSSPTFPASPARRFPPRDPQSWPDPSPRPAAHWCLRAKLDGLGMPAPAGDRASALTLIG